MYKTLIGSKPLRITFDKVDEFIRDYNRTKYLFLTDPEKCINCDKIRYLTRLKSVITYVGSHNYAKIKINSDDDLPLEKNIDNA